VRGGTSKILTLFQPATGLVRLEPVTRSTNAIIHPWLKTTLADIVAALPAAAAPIDRSRPEPSSLAGVARGADGAVYPAG
jgi:hypothetical protein